MASTTISPETGVVRRVRFSHIWVRFAILLSVIAIPPFPRSVEAGSCTKGVNCYCDRVRGGDLNDPQLLVCEDFEAPTLINDQGFGNGAPYYGPWYDHSGFPGCSRGANNYWKRTYGSGIDGVLWHLGDPATPTRGCTCSSTLCPQGAWHPTNLWQANSFAAIAILRNGEFDDEVASIGAGPTHNGQAGVFDGKASLGHRKPPGLTGGILGEKSFGSTIRTFGVTMAIAYPSNSSSSGIWGAPWKHDTFGMTGTGRTPMLFSHSTGALGPQSPFAAMQIHYAGDTQTTCLTKIAAATVVAGTLTCDDVNFNYKASASLYKQPTDWPLGTWGCVRGEFTNIGLTNASVKIWFTGPAGVEKKIVDFSNMDMTGLQVRVGINRWVWDSYANTNQRGGVPTTQTTFRYEDNVHVRAGAPVSCSQIGYGAGRRPSQPTGVQIR